MDFALSLISIEKIMDLPVLLSGPTFFLILLFVVRFLRSLFSLRLLTALFSLMYAFGILVIMSHLGETLADQLGLSETPQSSQYLLNHGHQRLT